ncbi:hypothetical protein D6C93_10312 [Aureobasidium pullulans]|uniref:SAP domain-containing protein n=1 Tax=Aureobasidium pullulans TaxID=5580 RepID=A0A4S8W707_AURPU|nr:hypothetical protein D6D24_01921 [Aureobasidium pullulans]THY76432.1 hypothetical protein D6C93_10312 [Aureobasidium pullulans]
MADYEEKTVAVLRQELKERGIPSTGLTRKAQIIEKLEEDDERKKGYTKGDKSADEQVSKPYDENVRDDSSRSLPSKRLPEQTSARPAKKQKPSDDKPRAQKPRLTTPDLEFEYDRSRLRDSRPTPGRIARPRYDKFSLSEDLNQYFENDFYVPKPERPPGRLDRVQKDELFVEQSRLDPRAAFHDLHKCLDKGPNGSPTADNAGFQLDYEKVQDWDRPQPYNKRAMIRGMDRAVDKARSEEDQIFDVFFVDGERPDDNVSHLAKDYVKDQISKDLNVPWHQIKPEHAKQWEKQGFKKVVFKDWWKEPTQEERRRFSNMLKGAALRKDL